MIPMTQQAAAAASMFTTQAKELVAVKRKFAVIATSVNVGHNNIVTKIDTINGYRNSADKVRVFGTPIPEGNGITNVKGGNLRSVFEDHSMGLKSRGMLVISTPDLKFNPVIESVMAHADKKHMGVTWAFYGSFTETIPDVFGFTPSITKILSTEIPEEVPFSDYGKWLYPWMMKYMQAHRRFDITNMDVCKIVGPKLDPKTLPEQIQEAVVNGMVDDPPPSLVAPVKRKKKIIISKS